MKDPQNHFHTCEYQEIVFIRDHINIQNKAWNENLVSRT